MTTTAPVAADPFLEFVERYGPHPALFVREVFGVVPDDWQTEVLDAYGRGERRISIRSCHGPGKTCVAAWIIVHCAATRFPQKTALTAPTSAQLFDALFTEVKKWMQRLPPALRDLFEIKADRIELRAAREESFVTARTSRAEKPEALQGIHCEPGFVLLVVDEASGVPEPIFEAAGGSMSGHHATTLLLSNPVRQTGFFYETHTALSDMWVTVHVGADDSPRVSSDFVEDMARRYGVDSNVYRVRVLGEFPRGDDDTFIPMELIEGALGRDVTVNVDAPTVWGLDVARFGSDRSALCKRQANVVAEPVRTWRNVDTMQLTGAVKAEWDVTPPAVRPASIFVDVIGIGAGVADRLRELGLPAIDVNVSEAASISDQYVDLRTELWGHARAWLAALNCCLPQGGVLRHELAAPRYEYDSKGTVKLEAKKLMKRRLTRMGSPDEADAFVLTFAPSWAFRPGRKRVARLRRNIRGIV